LDGGPGGHQEHIHKEKKTSSKKMLKDGIGEKKESELKRKQKELNKWKTT